MLYDPYKIFRLFLSIAALLASVQYILFPTLDEGFRHRLFAIRRKMFLLMAEKSLAPSTPAYTQLRTTINGLLRFTEKLSFLRLVFHGFIFRSQTQSYIEKVERQLNEIKEEDIRSQLREYRQKVGYEIIRHVLIKSPLAWCIGLFILPLLMPAFLLRRALKQVPALLSIAKQGIQLVYQHMPIPVQGVEAQAEALVMRF